ncbi:MAG: hypothetical protein IJT94_16220 [Oscillibacter sp.]|nr:hypothetical protein [Oscillibacter sp.]
MIGPSPTEREQRIVIQPPHGYPCGGVRMEEWERVRSFTLREEAAAWRTCL